MVIAGVQRAGHVGTLKDERTGGQLELTDRIVRVALLPAATGLDRVPRHDDRRVVRIDAVIRRTAVGKQHVPPSRFPQKAHESHKLHFV